MNRQAADTLDSIGNDAPLDVEAVRRDFPILHTEVQGKPLVYLDNAATTQKPEVVIDAVADFYRYENANIHRGVHYLSVKATDSYDAARARIARALNAREPREVIFVRGATEGINLVARTFGVRDIGEGDEIILTVMEHHANIVPWQILAGETGARIKVVPITESGELQLDQYASLLSDRTKLVAFTHVSNVLGTVNPVVEMTRLARDCGAAVLVDGSQALPHGPIDVQTIDCDFYVFSGHKVYGPDGIGVLYGRADLLGDLPPYQGGGDMIEQVRFDKTTFKGIPDRFEAGTPNISGAIGLARAFDYLYGIGWDKIRAWERALLLRATEVIGGTPGVKIIGEAPGKTSVVSFVMEDAHPHDIGTILDTEGLAIRAGHHCAQPLMESLKIGGTARASLAFYNTMAEIDLLGSALDKVRRFF